MKTDVGFIASFEGKGQSIVQLSPEGPDQAMEQVYFRRQKIVSVVCHSSSQSINIAESSFKIWDDWGNEVGWVGGKHDDDRDEGMKGVGPARPLDKILAQSD